MEKTNKPTNDIYDHFGNLVYGLEMALGAGVFKNFKTATQMQISLTIVEQFIKDKTQPHIADQGNGVSDNHEHLQKEKLSSES